MPLRGILTSRDIALVPALTRPFARHLDDAPSALSVLENLQHVRRSAKIPVVIEALVRRAPRPRSDRAEVASQTAVICVVRDESGRFTNG